MNSDKNPHVQQSVDMLAILPQLANGSRCAVFTCIGLFDADPLGASKRDILDYTGLSRQTVESALRFLEMGELISYNPSAKRYRAAKYYRYAADEHPNIRELVPVLQGERRGIVKNFSTSRVVVGTPLQEIDNQSCLDEEKQQTTTRRIFQRAGIFGASLDRLSGVNESTAQEWADWIGNPPLSIRNPQGIAVSALTHDPDASPPGKKLDTKREPHFQGVLYDRMKRKE